MKLPFRLCRRDKKMDARSALGDAMLMAVSTAIQAVPRRSNRRMSDFRDIAHLTVAFHGITLTADQQKLIKRGFESWKASASATPSAAAGEWVLEYAARRDGRLKALFERHADTTASHAEAISAILDMAVETAASLDDSLGPLLVSYVSENGVLEEKEGFDRDYWSVISEGLCQLAKQFPMSGKSKADTIAAWRIIVLFIINKIDYGFQLDHKLSIGSKMKQLQHKTSFDNPCYKL